MNVAIAKPRLGSAAASFLAKEHKLLIDGKWVAARSGQTFPVEDPATEEVITHVPAGDKADIDAAVAAAARRAFETALGRACRPASGRVSSGGSATCLSSMPTSSPSWRRWTTASR